MLTKPWPAVAVATSKPGPSSVTENCTQAVGLPQLDRHRCLRGVLGRVLQGLEAAEVHRRLELARVAAEPVGVDATPRAGCGWRPPAAPRPGRLSMSSGG